jgi:ABC-type polysaccharide/polyol phosphate export permease
MRALWLHRQLIWDTAVDDLHHRYAGSALGVVWNVLTPLALLGLYTVIFTQVLPAGVSRGTGTGLFVVYLASGFLPWGAFAECVTRATQALVANATYLKKLPIPEQVFVAQAAVTGTLGMLIALVLIVVTAPFLGQSPQWTWLLLPVVAVVWQTLGFGLGLTLSTLNVFFRDISQMLGIVFQLWMWSLPVVYFEDFLPATYRNLLLLNPAYPFIRALRDLLIEARLPDVWIWGDMLAWAALASAVGFALLTRLRSEIRDVL